MHFSRFWKAVLKEPSDASAMLLSPSSLNSSGISGFSQSPVFSITFFIASIISLMPRGLILNIWHRDFIALEMPFCSIDSRMNLTLGSGFSSTFSRAFSADFINWSASSMITMRYLSLIGLKLRLLEKSTISVLPPIWEPSSTVVSPKKVSLRMDLFVG